MQKAFEMTSYISLENIELPDRFADLSRHWSPCTEPYTGGDSLFAALQQGYQITTTVFCRILPYSHSTTRILYFQLLRNEKVVRMAVISSPHVERLIADLNLDVFCVKGRASFSPVEKCPIMEENQQEILVHAKT
jgi:hypothetical protein